MAIASLSAEKDSLAARIKLLSELGKLRLALLVILSAAMGFFIADAGFSWSSLLGLLFGGLLVTGGANALNQVLERSSDALMERTRHRPLPEMRITPLGAWAIAFLMIAGGFLLLFFFCNSLTAFLSLLSAMLYTAAYTPLKKFTPIAVFVGAIPGAMPPLLGWVAARGHIGFEALLLFVLQFFWQFPHFWAIAWRLHDDYARAGIYLLPLRGGPSRQNAWIVLLYTLLTVPAALLPYVFGFYGLGSAVLIALLGVAYAWPAWRLTQTLDDRYALRLLYASFLYLPSMQLAWWANF
ncbi:MAG: heme o synthase [Flavobacteriales bacterium]|nr:heme o synthase [Flavobacteriales bacterium]MCX7768574.1 heme o synthase [Flavobacteriales bacterium]MDW8409457.1 heme o synthase [Flavobacteriales bacterium]